MTWHAHLAAGFFGFSPGETPQPRWRASKVDFGEVQREVGDILEAWWRWLAWQDVAPPFAGGVLDEWPARLRDGLAVCRREWTAIQQYLQHERKR